MSYREEAERALVEKYGAVNSGRTFSNTFILGITIWEFPEVPGLHIFYGVENGEFVETKKDLFTAKYQDERGTTTMKFSPEVIINSQYPVFEEFSSGKTAKVMDGFIDVAVRELIEYHNRCMNDRLV